MKKHLLSVWITAVLLVVAAACTKNPDVDTIGKVGITQSDLTADGKGDELAINIASNAYWHIEFTDANGEPIRWVTPSKTSGRGDEAITLTVARNRSSEERTAWIVVITDSENTSSQILLTQLSGTAGALGYTFPICEYFRIDETGAFSNGFLEGNDCTFDEGMIFSRTGGESDLKFICPSHTAAAGLPQANLWLQRGLTNAMWIQGDCYEIEIPVQDAISGKLRLMFGSRRDNSTSTCPWAFEWSGDGDTWTVFEGKIAAGIDAVWKYIDFTIPADKGIPAGGKLMIRMTPTDVTKLGTPTVLFHHGICVMPAEAAKSELPAMDDKTVIFTCGFDEVAEAKAAYAELPTGFMSSAHGGVYALPKELASVLAAENVYTRPGYLQLGGADDAKNTYIKTGKYTVTLSRFEQMQIAKCDVRVTFRAAAYLPATSLPAGNDIRVTPDASSGASVENEGKVEGVKYNEFATYSVLVRNAKPETKITFSNATEEKDTRFFVDDIVITVEGEPVRPDENDPVKATIAEIRAKRGAESVTLTENLVIQGRVVAVDNIPADYFAVADETGGLFVKKTGHALAAGDLVQVVVKNATLAADAEGLLLLTPVAEKVVKQDAPSQMPEAKAVSVADLKAGTYEAMYVVLPASQVIDGDLAKNLGGSITLQTDDKVTTYTMKTYASATFSGGKVPQKSGVVKGVAGKNLLLPSSVGDLAAMTGSRFGEAAYGITPITGYMMRLPDGSGFKYRNFTWNTGDNFVSFNNGCTITKVGGGDCRVDVTMSEYDGRFYSKGWGGASWQQNGLVFKIKATSRIVGNLRFGFGLFAGSKWLVPKEWKILWSTDGSAWNEGARVLTMPFTGEGGEVFTIPTSANSGGYKMAYFNVPEGQAVAEGGNFYIKIAQASNLCREAGKEIDPATEMIFQHGFYLTSHEKRAYHTTAQPSGANVLLAEGFDDAFLGHDTFLPSWQFVTNVPAAYTMPDGWQSTGSILQGPGYIWMGSSATKPGTITTPALAALGNTPTNITVTFKAAIYLNVKYVPDAREITVKASIGNVGAQPDFSDLPTMTVTTEQDAATMDQAYFKWRTCSVKISGATNLTKITFDAPAGRHFIDDVVVTKD